MDITDDNDDETEEEGGKHSMKKCDLTDCKNCNEKRRETRKINSY